MLSYKKRSRLYNTTKNLIWQTIYQFFALLLGLILPSLIINAYGSEINGLTSTAKQIITLVTLAKAGISTAVTFYLYKPVETNDRGRIASVLKQTRKVFLIIGLVVLASGVVLSLALSFFQKSEIGFWYVFVACFLLCVQTAIDLAFTSVANIFFGATQKRHFISIGLLIFTFVSYGLEFLICIFKLPFILLYFAGIVGCLLKVIYLVLTFRQQYKNYSLQPGDIINKDKIQISGISFATLNEISHSVVFASQAIIISVIYGFAEASVFSVYAMVINALSLIAQIFYTSFSPSYGSIVAEGKKDKINYVFNIFHHLYCLLVTILYMSASFLFMPFINLYTRNVTDIDYNNLLLMILFVAYGIFYSLRVPYNLTMNVYGYFRFSGIQTAICASISVLLSIGLSFINYSLTLIGPIFFYVTNTFLQYIYIKIKIPYIDVKHLWKRLFSMLFSITLMMFLGIVYSKTFVVLSYTSWIKEAIAVFTISSIVTFALFSFVDKKYFYESFYYFERKMRKK